MDACGAGPWELRMHRVVWGPKLWYKRMLVAHHYQTPSVSELSA